TPVGTVRAELAADGAVTIENVPARLHARDVAVDVPGYGRVAGDVAYGGNWFFITHADAVPVDVAHVKELTRFTQAVQDAPNAAGDIVPFVRGTAYVTAESTLILDPADPFRYGIGA